MKPVVINSSIYFGFNKENNKDGPKFKVGDHVRILKYKTVFAEDCVLNW